MSNKSVEERVQPQDDETAKRDTYRTGYDHIDQMGLSKAWELARELDPDQPSLPPENLPESAKSAIISLARCVTELRYEWS